MAASGAEASPGVAHAAAVDDRLSGDDEDGIALEARRRGQRLQAKALFRSAKRNMQLADAQAFDGSSDSFSGEEANAVRAALANDIAGLSALTDYMSADELEMMALVSATAEKLEEAISMREAQRARQASGDEAGGSERAESSNGQGSPGTAAPGDGSGPEQDLGTNLKRRLTTVGARVEERVSSFVKSDGSVDFQALKSSVEQSVERFGETWARLNGLAPGEQVRNNRVMESYLESPVVWKLREEIETLEKKLSDLSKERESRLRREDQLGKLIRAKEIRALDDGVNEVRRTLALRVLQLEMERIYINLEAESGEPEPGNDVMEQRLLAVEFGQLDLRVAELRVLIAQGDVALVQDDELGVLANDILDFKSRLGLDSDLYTKRLDAAKIRKLLSTTLEKAKVGWEFYVRGFKLIGGDLWYAWQLLRKAAFGSTLSRREVRMLRRTARDILTLVPFTIILIIPMTPFGHVLVFSFIQRFFPDFFPSTFSEQRQETMKRYEVMRSNLEGSKLAATAKSLPAEDTLRIETAESSGTEKVTATAERILEDVRRQSSSRGAPRSTLLDDLHLGD